MRSEWINELKNADVQGRARIIKELALSGDQQNLPILIQIAENDPDPRIQEYARKAAKHIYSSQKAAEPEDSNPNPEISPPPAEESQQDSDSEIRTPPPAEIRTAAQKVQRAFTLHTSKQTKKALQVLSEALKLNPALEKDTFTRGVAADLTGKIPEEAFLILKKPGGWKEIIDPDQAQAPQPATWDNTPSPAVEQIREQGGESTSNLVQTWLSFFRMDEEFLNREIARTNTEDTLLSVLVITIAAVLSFLINGFFQFQLITEMLGEQLTGLNINLGTIFFFLLLGTLIFTPLTFYLSAGLQFLGVRLFGGTGSFKAQAYLMALIQVPITVLGGLISLLSLIPWIGFIAGLVGFGLSIYAIILSVRALKVAHNVSAGRAVAGIIVPPLILSFIGGCILMLLGSTLGSLLGQIQ